MSFAVQFGPNAERDFLRAQAYYDQVAPHQTDRFIASVFAASRVLADHPEIGRPLREDARRWHVGAFPYELWYRVDAEARAIRVIALVGDTQDAERLSDRFA
ncbi:MAG: type II toxin-antitoxin system RelE/ParE family toxin [Demequina sp.]|nr:type II toxin-antitoxin system RelE/ParE family toxin [Demequina sp.]